jgi:hypothetical protein
MIVTTMPEEASSKESDYQLNPGSTEALSSTQRLASLKNEFER